MENLTVKAARIDPFSVTQGLHLHPSTKYSSINLLYTNYIIMVILNSNLDTYRRAGKDQVGKNIDTAINHTASSCATIINTVAPNIDSFCI